MPPEETPGVNPDDLPSSEEIDAGIEEIREDSPEQIKELLREVKPDELASALEARLDEINPEQIKSLAKALDEIMKQAD